MMSERIDAGKSPPLPEMIKKLRITPAVSRAVPGRGGVLDWCWAPYLDGITRAVGTFVVYAGSKPSVLGAVIGEDNAHPACIHFPTPSRSLSQPQRTSRSRVKNVQIVSVRLVYLPRAQHRTARSVPALRRFCLSGQLQAFPPSSRAPVLDGFGPPLGSPGSALPLLGRRASANRNVQSVAVT